MMANAKRSRKEKAIQRVMAGCLTERGHTIIGWEKTGKKMAKADAIAAEKAMKPAKAAKTAKAAAAKPEGAGATAAER